jgi:hypothetical protein
VTTRGFVLDTNVVSETKRARPDPRVQDWFQRQEPEALYLAATSICELAEGVERMSPGRRRREMEAWLDHLVEHDFRGRILVLDAAAARLFGRLTAAAWAQERPPHMADAQIAAVAARDGFTVATRNLAHFTAFGVPLVDPWSAGGRGH